MDIDQIESEDEQLAEGEYQMGYDAGSTETFALVASVIQRRLNKLQRMKNKKFIHRIKAAERELTFFLKELQHEIELMPEPKKGE